MKKILFYLGGISIMSALSISSTYAYTQEEREAYEWAHKYDIISANTIDSANLNGPITRQALSKIIITYIENTEGIKNISSNCNFPDENLITPSLRSSAKKMCKYGLMGTNGQKFSPTTPVNNAQLGTVLSRVLRGDQNNSSGKRYYIYHVNALKKAGIMDNINNPLQTMATRGEVLVMLNRMYKIEKGSINSTNSNSTKTTKNTITCNDKNGKLVVDTDTLDWTFSYTNNSGNNICSYFKGQYLCSDSQKNIIYPTVSITEPAYTCNDSKGTLIVYANGGYKYTKGNSSDSTNTKSTIKNTSNNNNTSNQSISKATQNNISSSAQIYTTGHNNGKVIYTAKDGKQYYYDEILLTYLADKAKEQGENELYAFLVIEANHINHTQDVSNIDENYIAKKYNLNLDELNSSTMSKEDKTKIVSTFKSILNDIKEDQQKEYDKYLNNLKKITKAIGNDKYGLKNKSKQIEKQIEGEKTFLTEYFNFLASLLDTALVDEEDATQEIAEQQMAGAIKLLGLSIIYEQSFEDYEKYTKSWALNTINLLKI